MLRTSIPLPLKHSNFTDTLNITLHCASSTAHPHLFSFTPPLSQPVAPFVESFSFPRNLTRGKRLRVICTVTEGDRPLEVPSQYQKIAMSENIFCLDIGSQMIVLISVCRVKQKNSCKVELYLLATAH